MKIGFIQFNPLFGEIDRNIEKVRGLSKPVEADLMVLPEPFLTSGQIQQDTIISVQKQLPVKTGTGPVSVLCRSWNWCAILKESLKRSKSIR